MVQAARFLSLGASSLVGLDFGDLAHDLPLGFEGVEGVLQAQEVPLGQAKELAQPQIGVGGNAARAVHDGVDTVRRHADGMGQLVLAHPDFVQEFFLENFAGMRIAQRARVTSFRIATIFNDNRQFQRRWRLHRPSGSTRATGR